MKVVEACGCWTEQMPDGGVDQLVCIFHVTTMMGLRALAPAAPPFKAVVHISVDATDGEPNQ